MTTLTAGELAKRWGVTTSTITALADEGKLPALIDKGAGSHRRFSIAYIESIEKQGGFETLNRYDMLKVRRLESEVERLNGVIQNLKSTIDGFVMIAIQKRQEVENI